MQVSINEIKLRKRVRCELLEIDELAESIKRCGLLCPIIIDKENYLISGQRRIEAAKQLGWETIEAIIIPVQNQIQALEIEIEENTQRQKLTDEELFSAFRKLNKMQQPNFFKDICNSGINFLKKLFKKKAPPDTAPSENT